MNCELLIAYCILAEAIVGLVIVALVTLVPMFTKHEWSMRQGEETDERS